MYIDLYLYHEYGIHNDILLFFVVNTWDIDLMDTFAEVHINHIV